MAISDDTEKSIYFNLIMLLIMICEFSIDYCLNKVLEYSYSSKVVSAPMIYGIKIIYWYIWGNIVNDLVDFSD